MEFELKGALKKYRRMRAFRRFALMFVVFGGAAVPWIQGFNQTDTLICLVGALVLWCFGETEFRLKTMQIRLAGMDDKLDRLNRDESEGNLIGELNDW